MTSTKPRAPALSSSQSFRPSYEKMGLKPKRTPLFIAKTAVAAPLPTDTTGADPASESIPGPSKPHPNEAHGTTSKALVVASKTPTKRKRRSGWEILKDMWDSLWMWGNMSDSSSARLNIDQFGHTNVDGSRRSQRLANRSVNQNLIEGK